MKPELKKLLVLNLPYLLFVYLFAKCGQAYRLAAGADASAKLLHLTSGISAAFANPLPSLHPFDLCVGVAGAVAVRLIVYSKGKNAKKYRKGEEYGSARWGTAKDIAPYIDPKFENNILLTQTERLTMTGRPKDPKTARNKNVLVIGGSGSGKTRFYVKPNLMQCFPTSDYPTSFVVTDPKGTLVLETGQMFQRAGYRVKILNTINFSKSMKYNPFVYIHSEKDVLKLVNNLIQSTTPKGSHESDPFWSKSETALLQAIILMLFQEAPEYEQNFSMVLRVLEYAEVKEDDDEYVSPLDLLFRAMEYENPESVALRQYKVFKQAAGKTAKSILVSAAVRLAPFNLPQIKAVTDHDDMDLYTLGERKCALYAVIPDNDTTFTFLVSLLYSQIFQTLYYCADQIHHGALPCHVHFILDEAPSVNLPGLPRELATMRSRNISCSTIIQNMAQIKELYKDSWETIPGNSDTLLYLGGNEASTHKYISEALGKSTIDTKTHGQTKGRSGSYSTNFQISGRELLTPDEVRMLDNRYCILFIRGTRPVMDEKYELMEHPAIRYTMDGGGPPYIHHGTAEPPIPGEPLFQTDFDNEKENAAA